MENNYWGNKLIKGRRTCMLMITHACNLNCSYCYEKYKSNKTMSFELAKELILKECKVVQEDPRFHELEIDLMGGEPMMNFNLIKQLVEWTAENPLPVPWVFFITTNGTLFDEERKRWFKKYKHLITAGESYDGTPEMQRKNRDTAKGSIDMAFFHETWPWQSFHMTISKETLPYLAQGILEIQRKGYPLEAALAQGENWDEHDAEIYKEQLYSLMETYLQNPSLPPINILARTIDIRPSSDIKNEVQKKWCGSGTHMVTYDIDGKAYGCHLFTPVVLGADALEHSKVKWNCSGTTEDSYCKECILKMSCPTCAGFNHRFRNDISKRDHRWCKMIMAEKIVSCEFQIKILSAKKNNFNSEDAIRAEGVLKAYKILKDINTSEITSPFIYKIID